MDQHDHGSARKLIEVTDFEHTFILMIRTMRLNEIMCLIKLNKFLPIKLPNKHHHIMNIINMHFQKSYTIHTIRAVLEFITTESIFDQMFQDTPVEEMIRNYQKQFLDKSAGVYELYLEPYVNKCVQCHKSLDLVFSRRPKTVLSPTRIYKALVCTCYCEDCDVEIYPNFYIQHRKKYVTVDSIRNDRFIFLNGNQIIDQNLLIDFDQQLLQNTVSFEGYTQAYNSKIEIIYERQNQYGLFCLNDHYMKNPLNEKYFQMNWLFISIIKFFFMTTNDKIINIPMAVRDVDECYDYFLSIKDEMYKNFVQFWTQHQRFTRTCDPRTCSKIFIVDGHQKANRLICQYKDVFDYSIAEMGPVQTGCLFSPLRKGPNVDNRYCKYHQPITLQQAHATAATICSTNETNAEEKLDKLALSEYINKDGQYDDKLCNVFRSGINKSSKISSYGFLATFLNCSVIVGFTEQPCSEGMRRVLHHILTILRFGQLPSAMCYDCACTLKLFINKHFGSEYLKSTEVTRFLTSLSMAVDRFHVRNHTRPMCRTIMRPDHPCHNDIYASINTEVAEQLFAYLSKFKHSFRGYNYPKSTIFFTILFHLKNCKTTGVSSYDQAI